MRRLRRLVPTITRDRDRDTWMLAFGVGRYSRKLAIALAVGPWCIDIEWAL
jgi:hypothetical protein